MTSSSQAPRSSSLPSALPTIPPVAPRGMHALSPWRHVPRLPSNPWLLATCCRYAEDGGRLSSQEWLKRRMPWEKIRRAFTRVNVRVTMVAGRDLIAADLGGTSDPYVKLIFAQEEYLTSTVRKTVNPVWEETFEIKNKQVRRRPTRSLPPSPPAFSSRLLLPPSPPACMACAAKMMAALTYHLSRRRSNASRKRSCLGHTDTCGNATRG